jgi:hypothetical protein
MPQTTSHQSRLAEATNRPTGAERRATMALSITTVTRCAGDCCGSRCDGELVEVFASAKAKTVRVAPCSVLIDQGWVGRHQVAFAKEDARSLARWGLPLATLSL